MRLLMAATLCLFLSGCASTFEKERDGLKREVIILELKVQKFSMLKKLEDQQTKLYGTED